MCTWTSEAPGALLGAGVDAERVSRFEKLGRGTEPWRLVYSPAEAAHLGALPDPALAFCAAFCCKEALCKALGEAYRFPECEVFVRPGQERQELTLSQALRRRHGIGASEARVLAAHLAQRGELVAVVVLRHA